MKRAELFTAFLEEWQDKPAEWGVSDCSAWPARWVEVATGQKVPLPGYETQGEAARLIAKAGSLTELWRTALAETRAYEIDPSDVELGDVGIIETSDGEAGIIFANVHFGYVKAERGLCLFPSLHIVTAWRI